LQVTADKQQTIIGVWEKNYFQIMIPIAVLAIITAIIILLIRKPRKQKRPELEGPTRKPPSEVSGLKYRLGFLTDVGKVRSNNEDSILAMELLSMFESKTNSSVLSAVADGVGGSQKGEVASRLALQTLAAKAPAFMIGSGRAELESALRTAIESANESVIKYGMEHTESEGLATTIVASVIDSGVMCIAHAGDSRAYLINRGEIKQLTKDDSQVQELVDSGQLTAEQARHYPGRNVITRAVGAATDIEVSTSSLQLAPGDYIMLCSDGLWEPLTDAEIQKIVLESPNPQSACEQLVALANQRGGKDNASIVIVEVQSEK
jgi:protein phosphatase